MLRQPRTCARRAARGLAFRKSPSFREPLLEPRKRAWKAVRGHEPEGPLSALHYHHAYWFGHVSPITLAHLLQRELVRSAAINKSSSLGFLRMDSVRSLRLQSTRVQIVGVKLGQFSRSLGLAGVRDRSSARIACRKSAGRSNAPAQSRPLNVLYGGRLTGPFTMYKVFRRDCPHGLGEVPLQPDRVLKNAFQANSDGTT